MTVLEPTRAGLRTAVALLRDGAIVAVPTDTVYGLVCDPKNDDAVDRVGRLKGRPDGMELNVLGADATALLPYVEFDDRAQAIAGRFWPGALALVLGRGTVRLAVPRQGSTLMVRVPAADGLLRLLRCTGPLASTSANLHGEPPATRWQECCPLLELGVAAVLQGPPAAGGPSTIIDLSENPPRVLRAGPLTDEALRPFLGG